MRLKSLLGADARKLVQKAVYFELYASHLYRQIAACMQSAGFFGVQKWFEQEAADELVHFGIWRDYLNDRSDMAEIPQLPMIKERPETLGDALQLAFKTEKDLGDFYADMYDRLEDDIRDITTATRVLKFIEIETGSIGEYGDYLARLERCAGDAAAILALDQFIGDKAN